jgi:hypothetical protein
MIYAICQDIMDPKMKYSNDFHSEEENQRHRPNTRRTEPIEPLMQPVPCIFKYNLNPIPSLPVTQCDTAQASPHKRLLAVLLIELKISQGDIRVREEDPSQSTPRDHDLWLFRGLSCLTSAMTLRKYPELKECHKRLNP